MKTRGLIFIATLLATPALAEDIDQRMDADPEGEVQISNIAGSVDVRGWSRNQVEVTGTLGDDVEELIFERDGDEILIKVKSPKRMFGRSDITSDLTIRVPEMSSLDIGTVSADIDVRGVQGELELQSVSGDISGEVFGEDAEFGTVSGEISARGNGDMIDSEFSSVSGDISVTEVSGELAAESVSGSIQITNGTFESLDLETVNGRIVVRGNLHDSGDVGAESVNGSINIDIQNAVGAHYDIESFNGRISSCFEAKPERTSKYAPGSRLEYTAGSGRARVSVETLNGSIKVCEKD